MPASILPEPTATKGRPSWRAFLRLASVERIWSDAEREGTGPLWLRWRTVLLLWLMVALLLQANFIGVNIPTIGHEATTLPLHLQAGLLLSIALIYRDRRIVAACFLLSFLPWYARHYYHFTMPVNGALPGFLLLTLSIPQVWLCARWMGPLRQRGGLAVADVLRLGWVGLVLFPAGAVLTGLALVGVFGPEVWANPEMIARHALGRAFGVLIITFPLVVAWSERHNPNPLCPRRADGVKLVWMVLAGCLFLALKNTLLSGEDGGHLELHLSSLETVVILVLLLGWCALCLPPAWAVSIASVLMLIVFAFARVHYAEIGWGNFFSLSMIVYELAALQLAFICLVVLTRDARLVRLRREPSLKAIRVNADGMKSREGELASRFSQADDSSEWARSESAQLDPAEVLTCLRGGRLELYFQSIHSLLPMLPAGHGISGEILCRMRTADGRVLMPATFTPLLEKAGRGAELDLAVVDAVVHMLQQHKAVSKHFRRLSLNLSGQGLASRSFHTQLWRTLAQSPIPLSCFCFEITETAAIHNADAARDLLQRLRAEGCLVAIDDFGTGLQTFERLKEFPVDVIKIDGSFVRGVAERGNDYALVHACVSIAKAFGAQTVAEYVDSPSTLEVLRELGVDWGQGYLFSEPQPFAEVLR